MFKVGDKVKVVKILPVKSETLANRLRDYIDRIGVVTKLYHPELLPICVRFADGTRLCFDEKELELCSK